MPSAMPAELAEKLSDVDDYYSDADQAAREERAEEAAHEMIMSTEWWSECLAGVNPTSSEVAPQLARCMEFLDKACKEITRLPFKENIHLFVLTEALSRLQKNALLDATKECMEEARDEI